MASMIGRVCFALCVTSLAGFGIKGLDVIHDGAKPDFSSGGNVTLPSKDEVQGLEKLMNTTITSLGILVGFSWEQCFDGSVAAIAQKTEKYASPVFMKLGIGFVVSA